MKPIIIIFQILLYTFLVLNMVFFFFFLGLAFGSGSAVAHRAVDSVFGPRTIQHEVAATGPPPASAANKLGGDACNVHAKAFQDVCSSQVLCFW